MSQEGSWSQLRFTILLMVAGKVLERAWKVEKGWRRRRGKGKSSALCGLDPKMKEVTQWASD